MHLQIAVSTARLPVESKQYRTTSTELSSYYIPVCFYMKPMLCWFLTHTYSIVADNDSSFHVWNRYQLTASLILSKWVERFCMDMFNPIEQKDEIEITKRKVLQRIWQYC